MCWPCQHCCTILPELCVYNAGLAWAPIMHPSSANQYLRYCVRGSPHVGLASALQLTNCNQMSWTIQMTMRTQKNAEVLLEIWVGHHSQLRVLMTFLSLQVVATWPVGCGLAHGRSRHMQSKNCMALLCIPAQAYFRLELHCH